MDVTSNAHSSIVERDDQVGKTGFIGCAGLQRPERADVAVPPGTEGNCLISHFFGAASLRAPPQGSESKNRWNARDRWHKDTRLWSPILLI